MAQYRVTGEQYREIDKRIVEIKRQLNQKGGSPISVDYVLRVLQSVIEHDVVPKKILQKKKFSKEELWIPGCDAGHTFGEIDPGFFIVDSLRDKREEPCGGYVGRYSTITGLVSSTYISMYDVIFEEGEYLQRIFTALDVPLRTLAFTQSQIVIFWERYKDFFKEGVEYVFLGFSGKTHEIFETVHIRRTEEKGRRYRLTIRPFDLGWNRFVCPVNVFVRCEHPCR